MSGFLSFSSLGISAGLFLYGVQTEIIPDGFRFIILLALMVSGVVIAYTGVRSSKGTSESDVAKIASEVAKLIGSGTKTG